MTIVYACAGSHAPGMRAWPDKAPEVQFSNIVASWDVLRDGIRESKVDALIVLTSEHWANFFLDHISPFTIGLAETFDGPVEPWLGVAKAKVPGSPAIAEALLKGCADEGFDLSFCHEMKFDHGTMVPLSFLTPEMNVPVVPLFFNTLAPPRPSASRCVALGRAVGRVAQALPERVAIIATGGLSHDPGERNHGVIDEQFDAKFIEAMTTSNLKQLASYLDQDLMAAGGGTPELLAWLALAGAMEGRSARSLCYEPVKAWATGIGMVEYERFN
jgi:aromatic ring-opening dioxygenase catalytic subunit (LigB family)